MTWWESLLHSIFPPRTGLEVDEPNPVDLPVPADPASVVRAMALLAGPDAVLYWEGPADRVLSAWLRRQAGEGRPGLSAGITPVRDFHHLPATDALLAELAERLGRTPTLPRRVRLHLHDGGRMVLEWRRAFAVGPILVSRRIAPDRLAAFCDAIGATAADRPGPSDGAGDDYLRAVTVGEPTELNAPVTLSEYDPSWPSRFAALADRVRSALGPDALLLEHVGSTAVPGLAAKPVIDLVLAVADPADEAAYAPALERHGFRLRIREPDWNQHRLFVSTDPAANLHVFPPGSEEISRMIAFRDHLRAHDGDRRRYEATKRELAARSWKYVQHYADAKGDAVRDILTRARR